MYTSLGMPRCFRSLLLVQISRAMASYQLATASDVGFLQAKSSLACYYPSSDIVTYAGNTCTDALLSGALYNHLNVHVNPEAPSTAHYDSHLKFLGDYRWHIPSTTERGEVIACHQGALLATDKHEDAVFHTWCRFVTEDNQFNFTDALENGGVCSRIHAGGSRAERDGCVATRDAVSSGLDGWVVTFVLVAASFLRLLFLD